MIVFYGRNDRGYYYDFLKLMGNDYSPLSYDVSFWIVPGTLV